MSSRSFIQQLENKYNGYLRNKILGVPFDPVVLRGGKNKPNTTLSLHAAIKTFQQNEKRADKNGWKIEWGEWTSKKLGRQLWPVKIMVDSEEDFLTLIGKQQEVKDFEKLVLDLKTWRPDIVSWLVRQPEVVMKYADKWDRICSVVDVIITFDTTQYYLRNLPVPVHTKFVETHASLILSLITYLEPQRFGSSTMPFEKAIGVKRKPYLFPLRWLDSSLATTYGHGMEVIGVTPSGLQQLNWQVREVWLVENETTLYMLPYRSNAVALCCKGKAIELLSDISWIQQAVLYYWGDMDEDGYAMLSQCRRLYPHTISVLMDEATVNHHLTEIDTQPATYRNKSFELLHPYENSALAIVHSRNGRLEQEKLIQEYVLSTISSLPPA